jgi:hypothetical protein
MKHSQGVLQCNILVSKGKDGISAERKALFVIEYFYFLLSPKEREL